MGNNGPKNDAKQRSGYPAGLMASDPSPGSNFEVQGI